ncbi:hypothetical protein PQE75_gp200 [Bacillus phage vB_BcoS-136]|uniref:Uncharacterized protein n=1 Tax=Bacillus phage vB_BcoS-136 TaxID=2419619 RepID=A0A3G3BVJ3_9CAUD|nr:hypothetical protein PQE75_gp200 [Bacillus phage vB_BcoS-136]AYP68279.1 hypothetical protein vBBcoS136_00165 [Bacillus phage vB_BcoS-136]
MSQRFTFQKRENLGTCECCKKDVFDNTLYVREDDKVYHFSCHNMEKADDKK